MKENSGSPGNQPNQIFVQIFLPFFLFFALVVGGGYLLFSRVVSGGGDFRMWSDISAMFIFLPWIFFGIMMFVIVMIFVALVSTAQEKVLGIFKKVAPVVINITQGATKAVQFLTKPMIALKSGLAFFTRRK